MQTHIFHPLCLRLSNARGLCLIGLVQNMSQIKQIVRDLSKGKNVEENILGYISKSSFIYQQYSMVYTAMNYFILYERLQECTDSQIDGIALVKSIQQVVGRIFFEEITEEDIENCIKILDDARNETIKKMKILTTYTDKIQVYEHVLNRMEFNYQKEFAQTDIEMFTQKLVQYIFSSQDNILINESIKMVLGQLPVRMARSKYFQLIENSISVYEGAEKGTLERYIYMLETCAMLYEPEGIGEYFLDIREFTEELEKIDFSKLDENAYYSYVERVQEHAQKLMNIADLYLEIQNVINGFYAYLLSFSKDVTTDTEKMQICRELIKEIYELFVRGQWEDIPQTTEDKLSSIEGVQERIVEDMVKAEAVFQEILIGQKEVIEKMNYGEMFKKVEKAGSLLNASGTFIEFEQEEKEEIVTGEMIRKETDQLLHKIAEQFKENQMCVNRAVIANTIDKFPVFFTSSEEVKEYIQGSLERCQDAGERQASINILEELMEDGLDFE